MKMSEQDEKNLSEKNKYYKLHMKKYALFTYCLQHLNHTNAGIGEKNWLNCIRVLKYY